MKINKQIIKKLKQIETKSKVYYEQHYMYLLNVVKHSIFKTECKRVKSNMDLTL